MQLFIHQYRNQLTAMSFSLIVLAFIFGGNVKDVFLIMATVLASVPISIKAYQAVKMRVFSIELLVMLAVIGALFIGEYVESAVVTFLFLFGDFLEGRTLEKTRSSLRELTDMAPEEAVVLREGKQIIIEVDEVEIGDYIFIHAGGKVPVDGKIIEGKASIIEAAVTGESVPVRKQVEDDVFSGTIIDNGYIEIIAEKVGDDTTFAKIIELVEEAQESKSKTEKFLNKFANIYTPAIVVLSVLVYVLTRDLHIAITFLVIACPGALVIGAPVSSVAGIGNGAKNGVLIKGGEVMSTLANVDTIVFDKTGTLTKGQPEVTDVHLFTEEEEADIFALIATAETRSEHHLGKTIVKEAEKRGLDVQRNISKSEVIKGNGIRAEVESKNVAIGNRNLMKQENISIPQNVEAYAIERETLGNTAIFASIDGEIAAVISIADDIREDAKEALAELRKHGIKQMMMLTGDNAHTAKLVAEQLGLDTYYAALLPEDKVEHIRALKAQGHVVAMAGDGINDAPAIATADIGLAMGEGGTDVSMETADVVLMADKLTQFSHAYALAKATVRNMKQNTFFAVGTVFLLLIGVLQGTVHLASGMFVHEASVLLVILNGMRLLTFNRKKNVEEKNILKEIETR